MKVTGDVCLAVLEKHSDCNPPETVDGGKKRGCIDTHFNTVNEWLRLCFSQMTQLKTHVRQAWNGLNWFVEVNQVYLSDGEYGIWFPPLIRLATKP